MSLKENVRKIMLNGDEIDEEDEVQSNPDSFPTITIQNDYLN